MSDEWYRNTIWTSEIEEAYQAKLKRSRGQRDQYIDLKAHHLARDEPEAALELIDLYFETRSDNWDDGRAEAIRATARLKIGESREAVAAYKRLLLHDQASPTFASGSGIEFAFLVAVSRATEEYAFALETLSELTSMPIPAAETRYKYNTAKAILLNETGRSDMSRPYAADAMRDAEEIATDGDGPLAVPGHRILRRASGGCGSF